MDACWCMAKPLQYYKVKKKKKPLRFYRLLFEKSKQLIGNNCACVFECVSVCVCVYLYSETNIVSFFPYKLLNVLNLLFRYILSYSENILWLSNISFTTGICHWFYSVLQGASGNHSFFKQKTFPTLDPNSLYLPLQLVSLLDFHIMNKKAFKFSIVISFSQFINISEGWFHILNVVVKNDMTISWIE